MLLNNSLGGWLKFMLTLGLCTRSVCAAPPPAPYTPDADIQALEQQIKPSFASGAAIQNRLLNPLSTTGAMKTLNGTSAFNTTASCQNSSDFLEVVAFPGSTGDITTLRIRQDTDWDGQFDTVTNTTPTISGVCANGIISCDAGTWNQCRAYQWQLSNGTPVLMATALADLGGCYCINNSCGSALMLQNAGEIMGHLGAGVVSVLSQQNPTLLVSRIQAQDVMITYTGALSHQCDAAGPTASHQERFYADTTAFAQAASSTATLDTIFQTVTTGATAADTTTTNHPCTTTRTIVIDESTTNNIIRYNGGVGAITSCGLGCLQMSLGTIGDDYWRGTCGLFTESAQFWVEHPERILSATLMRAKFDDHIQVTHNGSLIWAHDSAWTNLTGYPPRTAWLHGRPFCERDTSWDENPAVDFTAQIKQAGAHDFGIRVAVSDVGEGYVYARIETDQTCDLKPDTFTDTCADFARDADCQVEKEVIDGITTRNNFSPTGLTPLGSTRTVAGTSCTLDVTRTWWEKQKIYACQNNRQFNLDGAINRHATVSNSATAGQYDDIRLDANTHHWVNHNNLTLSLPAVPSVDACEKSCKTTREIEADEAAGLGPESNLRHSGTSTEFSYHTCVQDTCPAGPGETVVEACRCNRFFNEATARMQVGRMAGKDIVCTSGTPSSLP